MQNNDLMDCVESHGKAMSVFATFQEFEKQFGHLSTMYMTILDSLKVLFIKVVDHRDKREIESLT